MWRQIFIHDEIRWRHEKMNFDQCVESWNWSKREAQP